MNEKNILTTYSKNNIQQYSKNKIAKHENFSKFLVLKNKHEPKNLQTTNYMFLKNEEKPLSFINFFDSNSKTNNNKLTTKQKLSNSNSNILKYTPASSSSIIDYSKNLQTTENSKNIKSKKSKNLSHQHSNYNFKRKSKNLETSRLESSLDQKIQSDQHHQNSDFTQNFNSNFDSIQSNSVNFHHLPSHSNHYGSINLDQSDLQIKNKPSFSTKYEVQMEKLVKNRNKRQAPQDNTAANTAGKVAKEAGKDRILKTRT